MSTILENISDSETGYPKRLICKGGGDIVLDLCTHYINENGEKEQITVQKRKDINQILTRYCEQALRCLCLAYKDLNPNEGGQDHDQISDDGFNRVIERGELTLIAIVGIRDIL